MSYYAIAREEAAIVERTGLIGEGSAWAGRQVVARFFIAGFGNAEQRAAWSSRIAAVAISEPRVGAHPKLLATRAENTADGYCIFGEKAWVTNGPLADVFIVLAITAMEGERKRYSALLVPRDTPGLTIDEAPQYRALAPSRHCGLILDGCHVPQTALLGDAGTAYETKALPFRDVEDAVGTFGKLGAFRFLLSHLPTADALSFGGMASLLAVYAEAAEAVVGALDTGVLTRKADTLVGLHVLAAELLSRARAYRDSHGPADDEAVDRVFSDLDVSLSVAKGPRQARQMRLATRYSASPSRTSPC